MFYSENKSRLAVQYGLIDYCCNALKQKTKLSQEQFKMLTLLFLKCNSFFEELYRSDDWVVPENEV